MSLKSDAAGAGNAEGDMRSAPHLLCAVYHVETAGRRREHMASPPARLVRTEHTPMLMSCL